MTLILQFKTQIMVNFDEKTAFFWSLKPGKKYTTQMGQKKKLLVYENCSKLNLEPFWISRKLNKIEYTM